MKTQFTGSLKSRYTLLFAVYFLTTHTLLSQVSNGTMEDIVVCGESVHWEVITDEAGTLVIDSLLPGFSFDSFISSDCGATLTSSNPPTFSVPSACTLVYAVYAECEAYTVRDENQGGNPNLVFKVVYTWNGNPIIPQDVTGETNVPELTIELISNGTPISPYTDFIREFRICNDGLDSYLDDPLEICFDNDPDLTLNSATLQDGSSGTPLTITGSCVNISVSNFMYALDRMSLSTGLDIAKFEGSSSTNTNLNAECFYIDLDMTLSSCDLGAEFDQEISTNWGCSGIDCAIPETLPVSSNVTQEVPNVNISAELFVDDGCNLEYFFYDTIYIENTGLGRAENVYVKVNPVWNLYTAWAFDIDNILLDDSINTPYLITANLLEPAPMTYQLSDGPACNQNFTDLGGGTAAVSFDLDLPISVLPGQTIKLVVPMYFCCNGPCRTSSGYDRWEGAIQYSNTCNTSQFFDNDILLNNWFSARNETSPRYSNDMNDGDMDSIIIDIVQFSMDNFFPNYGWENRPFYEIELPCGIDYTGNAGVYLKNGDFYAPDFLNWDVTSRILYLEWDYPLVNGDQTQWPGGLVKFDIAANCTCGGGNKTIEITSGYVLGNDCTEYCENYECYNININLHCGGCPWVGITPDDYTIVRTSYGLTDNDDDGLPDDSSTALVEIPLKGFGMPMLLQMPVIHFGNMHMQAQL